MQVISNISIVPPRDLAIDEVSGSLTYLGIAKIGAATSSAIWSIRKIEKTGNVTTILWADGNNKYDNVWDNRASLSYS